MVLLELSVEYHIFMDIILITSLLGLGIGYYLKDKRCHKFRLVGLILFGIFWVLQVPYFFSIGDVFNAIVCILALPFYAYLGYHEYLSYIWDEENKSLKWITGASFFAGGLYFLIDKIPIFSGYLIYSVAVQTVGLINLFGFDYGVGSINYAGNPLWYRTNYNEISVQIIGSRASLVQACTAAQSMLIFIAAIYCVQALKKQKWKAFFATVPVIYVLNLIRNVGIIYMMDELKWSYDVAHNTVGKGGSFIALIVLAFIAFKLLPELLDNIWGLIDLKDRQKKKEEIGEEKEGEPTEDIEEEVEEEKKGEQTEKIEEEIEEEMEGEQKKEVEEEKEGEQREEVEKEEFEEEDPKKEMENEVTVKTE